jgi:predicted RNase H-like nuclease (RuvC/YqgF family)
VEDLLDRVAKAEEKAKPEEATKQKTTRSAVATQSEKQLASTIKALEAQTNGLNERLEEVESIVDQLNDPSTQPTRDDVSDIRKLTTKIEGVEKQLHAAIGAKHK